MENGTSAYVYTCVDPKVWPHVVDHYDKEFGKNSYFIGVEPGGAKHLIKPTSNEIRKFALEKILAAYKLHPFPKVIIVAHSNCGAYKLDNITFDNSEEDKDFHNGELEKAKRIINEALPEVEVITRVFDKEKGVFFF